MATKAPTVQYDTKTGKKLSAGQSTVVNGKTVKAGSTYTGANAYGSDSKIVNYDTKTGSMLKDGQSTIVNGKSVSKGSTFVPVDPSIAGENIGTKAIQVPPKNPAIDWMGNMLAGNQGLASGDVKVDKNGILSYVPKEIKEDDTAASTSDLGSIFNGYVNGSQQLEKDMPNAEKEYAKLEKESKIKQYQQDVQNYSSQINTITARAQAAVMAQEGQGRGIPEYVLGGQSAAIHREAAIQALPLQALLANAQGNVELAQSRIETLFKLKMQDAQNRYEFRTKMFDAAIQLASKAEERQYQEKKMVEERVYKEKEQDMDLIKQIAYKALDNGASNSIFTKIMEADSFADLAKIPGISSVMQKPTTNEGFTLSEGQTRYDANGNAIASGTPKDIQTPEQLQSKLIQIEDQIGTVDSLLNHKGLSQTVGSTWFSRGGSPYPGRKQDFIASTEQLLSQLTLESLVDAKSRGATFGALSDSEMRILSASASKIGTWAIKDKNGNVKGYKASEKAFKEELDKISNFAKRDFVLKGGNPDNVGATTTPDGAVWANSKNGIIQLKAPGEQAFKQVRGDTNAASIANAIKQVESKGNYLAKGGSGESGAYQFMPGTWKQWAGQYLGNPNSPLTQENQDKVAIAKISDLLDQGYNAEQIALIWNGGQPKVKKGVNKYGVAYDSGAYARKVLQALG